ncbi:MAG: hypothetical protein NTW62_01510 [Candidatus Nomurabacteria bacterium]|nr:hypothetical protein [Candidatus Nomurabacteria bacterium]
MRKKEYIEVFNKKRSSNVRKLNLEMMDIFEKKFNYKEPYNDHIDLRDKISIFLSEMESNIYLKMYGGKNKRKRDPSLLKNTKIEIKSFLLSEDVHYSWSFLADDLTNKRKYFWNAIKEDTDRRKNKNQLYFNPQEAIDDFLKLELKEYPICNEDKQKIIEFLKKYGPYFIRYYDFESEELKDKEWYFWHFWMDYSHFKKAFKIIKEGKVVKFPNAPNPSLTTLNKLKLNSEEWEEEIGKEQLFFKLCLSAGNLPIKNDRPQDLNTLGRGIGVLTNYLYLNCKKLINCKYSKCNKNFFQQRKNQLCCCSYHTELVKNQKYKDKVKKNTKS